MTTLSVADGARMLGIHPKTLQNFLKQAQLPLAAHPTDARIKCLTLEHVQQVARLHGRPLQSPASSALLDAASAPGSSQGQATHMPENEVEHLPPARPLPPSCLQEADLIQKLSCLETKVVTRKTTTCPACAGAAPRARESYRATDLGSRNRNG